MGHLKGGQIDENITIQISTMSYKLRKEASKKDHSGVLTGGRLNGSLLIRYGGFSSSSQEFWRHPQKVPPSHNEVGGGVPPNRRLPHPRPLGPLEMRL